MLMMLTCSGFALLMSLATVKFLYNFQKGVNLIKSMITLTYTFGLASCVFGTNYVCQIAKNEVNNFFR